MSFVNVLWHLCLNAGGLNYSCHPAQASSIIEWGKFKSSATKTYWTCDRHTVYISFLAVFSSLREPNSWNIIWLWISRPDPVWRPCTADPVRGAFFAHLAYLYLRTAYLVRNLLIIIFIIQSNHFYHLSSSILLDTQTSAASSMLTCLGQRYNKTMMTWSFLASAPIAWPIRLRSLYCYLAIGQLEG